VFCQHGSALGGGSRGDLKALVLVGSCAHPPAPRSEGPAASLWPGQTDRQWCFCVFCWQLGGCWGQSLSSESPCVSSPQPTSPGGGLQELADGWWGGRELLARRRSPAAPGLGKPAWSEALGEWTFSVLGTMLKGRSVTRWSRGRHLSNKCLLHKVTAWVIAFLCSPCTKPSGK